MAIIGNVVLAWHFRGSFNMSYKCFLIIGIKIFKFFNYVGLNQIENKNRTELPFQPLSGTIFVF